MKKNKAAKSIRRYAAVMTLVFTLFVLLVPYVQAKYISKAKFEAEPGVFEEYIDTGVSGVSNEDLDALFALWMDERYPSGSIFMSLSPNPPGYGSWTLWGQGLVPLGVDAGNIMVNHGFVTASDFTPPYDFTGPNKTGGNLNGNSSASITASNVGVTGTIGLSDQSLTLVTQGSIALTTSMGFSNISTSFSGTNSSGTNITLGVANTPPHDHNGSDLVSTSTWQDKNTGTSGSPTRGDYGSGTNRTWGAYDASGTSTADYTDTTVPSTVNNSNRWGIAVQNSTGGAGFTVPGVVTWTTTPSVSYTAPTVDYASHPAPVYTQQTVTGYDLKANGSDTKNVPDNTLQSYFVCYIYIRS